MRSTTTVREIALDGVSLGASSDFRDCQHPTPTFIGESTQLVGTVLPTDRQQDSSSTCWQVAAHLAANFSSAGRQGVSHASGTTSGVASWSAADWRTCERPYFGEHERPMSLDLRLPVLASSDKPSPAIPSPAPPPRDWPPTGLCAPGNSALSTMAQGGEGRDRKHTTAEDGKSKRRRRKKVSSDREGYRLLPCAPQGRADRRHTDRALASGHRIDLKACYFAEPGANHLTRPPEKLSGPTQGGDGA